MIKTQVCIIGAGPGGAVAAMKLHQLGISCVLLDKSSFPRDKICGDALSGKVTLMLKRLDPLLLKRLQKKASQVPSWGVRFVAPNQKFIDVGFTADYNKQQDEAPGHVIKRIDFDAFLVEEVKKKNLIQLLENTVAKDFEKVDDGYIVKTANEDIQCKLVIDASGAQSKFSRVHGGLTKDPAHFAGGVRAYFENVEGMHEDNFIELHFLKNVLPGYFWVFPLPNNQANIGLGLLNKDISKRSVNLRKLLEEIIKEHPAIKDRFKNAILIDKIQGFGLPMGSKKRKLSGDNYMLIGDAAHLIDPLTGEGIGNAIYSGTYAAEQAAKCIEDNNFSRDFLAAYDERIYRVLGQELRVSHRLQKMMRYPRLINILARWGYKNKQLSEIMSVMFTDIDLRGRFASPKFWFKLIFNRG